MKRLAIILAAGLAGCSGLCPATGEPGQQTVEPARFLFVKDPSNQILMDSLYRVKDKKYNAIITSRPISAKVAGRLQQAGYARYALTAVFMGRSDYRRGLARPVTVDGQALKPEGWYHGLSPAEPALQKKRLARISRLAGQNQLEGIFLDFIRWPVFWERPEPRRLMSGYSRVALDQFCRFHNCPPGLAERRAFAAGPGRADFTAWRHRVIVQFVERAAAITRKAGKKLGLFLVPAYHDPALASVVAQDHDALCRLADYCAVMLFHQMTGHDEQWLDEAINHYRNRLPAEKAVMVLQSFKVNQARLHKRLNRLPGNLMLFYGDNQF